MSFRHAFTIAFSLSFFPCLAQRTADIDLLLLEADYPKAIQLIDETLKTTNAATEAIILTNKKAEAFIRLGKLETAETLLKEVSTTGTLPSFAQAITQTTYGLLYLHQGKNDRSLTALQDALNHFDHAGRATSLEAAQALAYLGNLYHATGKYAQAEEQLIMALTLREKQLPKDHEWIAAAYNDLGLVYSATDTEKALTHYEKALALYEKIHRKNHPKIAIVSTNIGHLYKKLTLYGDAINHLEAALAIWGTVYPQAHPSKAFVLFSLGQTYQEMNDLKTARQYYRDALQMYEHSYGMKHPERARVLNALGNLAVVMRQYDESLRYYQSALQANTRDFFSNDPYHHPTLENFYDGNVLLYSLLYKAQALEARHYGKTLKFEDLTRAIQTLQLCDSLIDKLRQQISRESDKFALGAIASEVYGDGVRMATDAGQLALRKKPYAEQAFYFAEKSKAAVLLEAIVEANAKSFAGIPSNLLEEEKNQKAAIALCAQKLAQKPPAEEEKHLREVFFSMSRTYEAFIRKLEREFPDYYNLKYNATAPSIRQLQQKLDDHTALLSYFTEEKNNKLYIFVITRKQFHIIDRALPAAFEKYITGLRNSLFFNDANSYQRAAETLSALLIPNHIRSSIDKLVILPTGRMSTIPFEALPAKALPRRGHTSSANYLLSRYAIRYELSASLILQKANDAQHKPSIFLCAPVKFPANEGLQELPATEAEVRDIAKIFAAEHYTNRISLRGDANETHVKSGGLNAYTFLHFATHGIVDENQPELSRIFLHPSDGSQDGRLYAGEIYNLELNARLVTLSACQTGLGKISKGEGMIGLSRALVYAGAQRCMVSLWSVADESTAVLMKDFYKLLLKNPSADFSTHLREAKLNLMNREQYATPFYWAPFILIGF